MIGEIVLGGHSPELRLSGNDIVGDGDDPIHHHQVHDLAWMVHVAKSHDLQCAYSMGTPLPMPEPGVLSS